ncbi:MAG: hypothetical protein V4450_01055 [Bacteroidota bacterium]
MASAILPVSCFKSLTTNDIVYQNNFEDSRLNNLEVSGWNNNIFGPVTDTRIFSYDGSNVLGKLNSNLVQLRLDRLPSHKAIRVDMILNIHNNWKNELWAMRVDGNYQLITGFSNDPATMQSYPNWLGNGSPLSPAGCNAMNTALPGVCSLVSNARGTSRYQIVTTIQHSASSVILICNDAGGVFNDTCQRSWSLDNLKVSVLNN